MNYKADHYNHENYYFSGLRPLREVGFFRRHVLQCTSLDLFPVVEDHHVSYGHRNQSCTDKGVVPEVHVYHHPDMNRKLGYHKINVEIERDHHQHQKASIDQTYFIEGKKLV